MKRGEATPKVASKIIKATRLRAFGHTYIRIARHLGMKPEGLRGLKKRHPAMWEAAEQEAIKHAAKLVRRKMRRSQSALDDVMRSADAVANSRLPVLNEPGEAVTQAAGSKHTVGTFLERYLIPCRLQEASPETIGIYRKAARKFAVLMGNPTLDDITNEMLAKYREALKAMPARGKNGRVLSVNTVRMYVEHLQIILDKAGPAGPRNRDAAGFLKVVPYVKPPAEEIGERHIVADDVLAAVYAAAEQADYPKVDFATPAQWWRALLVTARYLGLRSRTLFKLRCSMLDFEQKRIVIPAKLMKSRKKMVFPMPDVIRDHLAAIRSEREYVFEWPHSLEWFRKCLHKLQEKAGVDVAKHFGLHGLRRTAITRTWQKSPAAAQLLAGHGSPIITRLHYVNEEEVLAPVLQEASAKPFMESE